MPWNLKQHRLFEAAAHNPTVAKRVGIPRKTAAHMAGEGIKRPMNPAMPEHNLHPMHGEVVEHAQKVEGVEDKHGGGPRESAHGGLHYLKGSEKRNVPDQPEGEVLNSHDAPREASKNFAQREHHDGKFRWDKARVGHQKSFASESKSVDMAQLRRGEDEGKSGYGNPEAGRTSLPATPGIRQGEHSHKMGNKLPEHGLASHGMRQEPRDELQDETRGTVELPAEQYSEQKAAHPGRKVPQESHGYVRHIANALLSARNRR